MLQLTSKGSGLSLDRGNNKYGPQHQHIVDRHDGERKLGGGRYSTNSYLRMRAPPHRARLEQKSFFHARLMMLLCSATTFVEERFLPTKGLIKWIVMNLCRQRPPAS